MDDLPNQLRARLQHLLDSVKQDSNSVQSYPDAKKHFQDLFDALQSTLQNVNQSPADKPDP